MADAPAFLRDDYGDPSLEPVQRPAQGSRRGEGVAWLCTLGAIVGSGLWAARSGSLPALGIGLTVFFALAAILISFGNWLDRNTTIQWSPMGVDYHSPLRKMKLGWDEIDALWAVPTARSWRVGVRGGDRAFAFRTGGKMSFGSTGEMAVGFENGAALAALIRRKADLDQPKHRDGRWLCERGGS